MTDFYELHDLAVLGAATGIGDDKYQMLSCRI